jgi:ABC-type nickel/cobalt efflux system permease component RcnA
MDDTRFPILGAMARFIHRRCFAPFVGIALLVSLGGRASPQVAPVEGRGFSVAVPANSPPKAAIGSIQKALGDLSGRLMAAGRTYGERPSAGALVWVALISLAYGLLHAIGPGHGKSLIVSTLLAKSISIRRGVILALSVAFLHILVAVSIVGVLWFILKLAQVSTFHAVSRHLTTASAVMILAMGVVFLIQAIRERRHRHGDPHGHGHEHHGSAGSPLGRRGFWALVFSIGLVPCPGPISILLLSAYAGYVYVGLISAAAMAVGMGLTYSLAVLAVTGVKRYSISIEGPWGARLHTAWEFLGALLILGIGALLLISSMPVSR